MKQRPKWEPICGPLKVPAALTLFYHTWTWISRIWIWNNSYSGRYFQILPIVAKYWIWPWSVLTLDVHGLENCVLLRYNWCVWYGTKNSNHLWLFLNKNQCTHPTLTFQSIEVRSNRRTSVQKYLKICHFSSIYLRRFTSVRAISK